MVKSTKKNNRNNKSKHNRLSLKKIKGGAPEEQPTPTQTPESKLQEDQNIIKEFIKNYNNKKEILDNKIQKIKELKTDNNEHLMDYISKLSEYDYLHSNLYHILNLINKQYFHNNPHMMPQHSQGEDYDDDDIHMNSDRHDNYNYNNDSMHHGNHENDDDNNDTHNLRNENNNGYNPMNNDTNTNDKIKYIKKYIDRINKLIKEQAENNGRANNQMNADDFIANPQQAEKELYAFFNMYDEHLNNILEHTREKLILVKKKMNDIDDKLNETNNELKENNNNSTALDFPFPPTHIPKNGGSLLTKSSLHKSHNRGKRKNKRNNKKRTLNTKSKNRKNRTKKKY